MNPVWRVALSATTIAALAAIAAPPTQAVEQGHDGGGAPIVGSQASAGGAGKSTTVTLVTGDRVVVVNSGGAPIVTVLPREDGTQPLVQTRLVGDDVYVYPADAAAALADGKVDEELFNVTGLIRQGYDDAHTDTIPLIAQYTDSGAKAPMLAPRGTEVTEALSSIDSVALEADKSKTALSWADLTSPRGRSAGSLEKLWLDSKVYATLDQSTKQVHAPEAWAKGFDGAGTTVAVLDTGADADHPDLQGRIVAGQDFTGSESGSWNDGNGHGTHVASTVGGSGAASGGTERGVAPGTDLLIGKVLTDSGSGETSDIISAMEWAVAEDADVISMSLGSTGPTTDGCTDPLAQAAQMLSVSSTSLFVIAAGNLGPGNNTVSSPGCAPAVLTVGAVDSDDDTAVFSSRGPVAGTHTLKPEITAPGVDISAAAAGGRGTYAYQTMSGTSMATPHVAGAAAVVKQRHPNWTGQQIKAALVSSAETDISGDVRETGGGRLDVEAAVEETVTGAPSLQGGSYAWPQVKGESATIQVPYTNTSDQAVTLQLNIADVTGNDGSPVKSKIATLGKSSVTVASGATKNVALKVKPAAKIKLSQYGDVTGRILATGDATVSTPFSLYVAPRTVHLTVVLLDRNGAPAIGSSSVDVISTDDNIGTRRFNDGAAEQDYDLRPGKYFVSSYVVTPDAAGVTRMVDSVSYLARPQLSLTKDTTLVLDARKAHQITVKTDRLSEARNTTLAFSRTWDDLWQHAGSIIAGPTVNSVYADIRGTASDGTFEFDQYSRRYAPLVENLSVVGGSALHPIAASYSSVNLDATGEREIVDAGTGTQSEVDAAGVAGKIALIRIADGSQSVTSPTFAARQAGAVAVLVYHAASGRWQPAAGTLGTTVPVYSIPSEEAADLQQRLTEGQVNLQWTATASSPFTYNLGFTESGAFTHNRKYVVHDSELGRTDATYRAMGVATDYLEMVSVVDESGSGISVSGFEPVHVPGSRTELYTAGDTSWQQGVLGSFPYGEVMIGQARAYEPGSVRTESWYDGVLSATAAVDVFGETQLTAERQGNLLGFASGLWGDSSGHWSPGGSFGDGGALTLSRNGQVIGELPYTYGVFDVPAEDSEYELTMWNDKYGSQTKTWKRSAMVVTTWKFRSHLEDGVYSQGLPIMFPRIDLPEDGLKTLPAEAGLEIPLRVTGHAGYTPGEITTATLAYSYDGSTWTDAEMHQQDGGWVAVVDHTGASAQPVTLRVQLTDSNGNSVTQTVTRAYDVR